MLASLNHANIATIHGFEESGGVRAIVLELVDGPTLADRIAAGPVPLDDAVGIARQIAIGLEAAHEQGIVHRDLKPANVKLRPDGTVKLLDFGLAKVVQPDAVTSGLATPSPTTITSPSVIERGVLLGTAAYVSPEQAKGREADRRSDVWAFGALLYEMLSGVRAFKGDDISETLAAVLRADVDWSRLPATTPIPLRRLLSRCLDRNVARRLRDIGEARIVLEDLALGTPHPPNDEIAATSRAPLWRRVIAPAAAAVVAGVAVAAALWPPPSPGDLPVTRFALSMSADSTLLLDPQSRDITITPDGKHVIYKGGTRLDQTQLFVFDLDKLAPKTLTSVGMPKGPFASPDGRWVGFFEPGQPGAAFKKVAIGGGPAMALSQLDGPSRGSTWGDDGSIIAASGAPSTGLLRIPPAGGALTVLTRPNREQGEADHLWPQFLPGGKSVLFTITALAGGIDAAEVAVLDLASGEWKTLLRAARQAHYVPSGHLVYVAGGALWAIPFDVTRLETIGSASVVVPQLVTLPTGVAEFDVARDGTLVYVARGGARATPRTLVWVDRQGREEAIAAPPRPYATARLSPDATRVALEIEDQGHDIWVLDLARGLLTQITNDPGMDQSPVWMPDGRRLVFTSQSGGVLGSLFMQAADGTGVPERLSQGEGIQRASAVLADGSGILFSEGTGPNLLTLGKDRRIEPLVPMAQGGGDGVISPDGRWLAYVGFHSRTPQVFVSAFPNPGEGRTQISPAGGSQPKWAPDGRALFYTGLDGVLMSVSTQPGATLSPGTATPVLDRPYYGGFALLSRTGTYDVSPDGRRFLMLKQSGDGGQPNEPATVVVVKNWGEELKRLVPANR